ncbi:MAG: MarR family transcriptional regulator [Saprospiraceae bacterium]
MNSYGEYLDRTAKLIKIDLARKFKNNGIEITPEQWVILSKLNLENGQSQTKLGESSYKDAPTVSRIIDLLCKKGLTTREPFAGDRRRFKINLTKKGQAIVKKATPFIQETRNKGWQGLADDDYDTLMRIINRISANFID